MSAIPEKSLSRLCLTIPLAIVGAGVGVAALFEESPVTKVTGVIFTHAALQGLTTELKQLSEFSKIGERVSKKWTTIHIVPECAKRPFKKISDWFFAKSPLTNGERLAWSTAGAAAAGALTYSSDALMRYAVPGLIHGFKVSSSGLFYALATAAHKISAVSDETLQSCASHYAALPNYASNPSTDYLGLPLIPTVALGIILGQFASKKIEGLYKKEVVKPVEPKMLDYSLPDLNDAHDFVQEKSGYTITEFTNILHNDSLTPITLKCADGVVREFQNVTVAVLAQQFWEPKIDEAKKIIPCPNIEGFKSLGTKEAYELVDRLIKENKARPDWMRVYLEKSKTGMKEYGINHCDFWLFQALKSKYAQYPAALTTLQATASFKLTHTLYKPDDATFARTDELLYYIRNPKAKSSRITSLKSHATAALAASRFKTSASLGWGPNVVESTSLHTLPRPPSLARAKPKAQAAQSAFAGSTSSHASSSTPYELFATHDSVPNFTLVGTGGLSVSDVSGDPW